MNELEAIRFHLERYRAVLASQVDRLYNALEELQRTTLLLLNQDHSDEAIDRWFESQGFGIDEDGFYLSLPLLSAFRENRAPDDAFSISWEGVRSDNRIARHRLYCHRNIGSHLQHLHDRLGDVGWIYYQDESNTSLQFPYIDQRTAITSDFDWSTYHTYVSVCPENNPERSIRWTPPSVDYAGEGLILSVSIPVWKDNAFIGLWSIDLPIRYLYRDFASTSPFTDLSQFIVDREGMLILHENLHAEIDPDKGQVFLHSLSELGGGWQEVEIASILAGKEGVIGIQDNKGVDWQYCYSFVPGVDWILFSGLPTASMEEYAARRLSEAFQQIGHGNFSHRIDADSASALPTLVEEFNKMSLQLSEVENHRLEIENQLRQAQKMEAIGRLAGGVAHDYNNMINVIMGYAELALSQVKKGESLYEDLLEISEAARRSMELTRQLLAFARRQSIAPEVLDINSAVKSMLKMLHRLIGEDTELIFQPGNDVWPIKIDPSQVDQILANLCVNSRDAMDGVGSITIETANTVLDNSYCALHKGFIPGEYVQLTVSDDGKGMGREVLENVFEPFFTTKEAGRGTGLGLATVYGIVKQNNGFINVYSEPDRGTTFKIYIPRVPGEATQIPSTRKDQLKLGGNETILLVEDEPAILRLAERVLRQLNYSVIACQSPREAIRKSEEHEGKIDLLLTDVIMPELNGQELAKKLRGRFPKMRVLYMSGYTSNVILHRGILDKGVILLQKPFSKEQIAAKIIEALSAKK